MTVTATADTALQQRTDRWRSVDNELTRLTETATPKVRRLIRAEGRIVDKVLAAGGPAALDFALEAVTEEEWVELLETLWFANGEVFFSRTLDDLEVFDALKARRPRLTDFPEAVADARRVIVARAEAIVANTRRRITERARRAAIQEAGNLADLMRSEIRELYSTWEAGRVGSIARHTVLTATAQSQHAAARASGLLLDKEWVSMQDDRVRAAHAKADGQTVGFEAAYIVGGEKLQYPRDPDGSIENTANCRCQQIYKPMETTITRRELDAAADRLLAEAAEIEEALTDSLKDWADDLNGSMEGLDFRFKGKGSLKRKLQDEVREIGQGATMDLARGQIQDALRYTMVLPDETFAEGMRSAISRIRRSGGSVNKGKKYWVEGNSYFGSNYTFNHPNGYVYELQFHTRKSLTVKEEFLHPLYEQWRVLDPASDQAERILQEMQDAADTVSIPSGLDDVPGDFRAKTLDGPSRKRFV